jgi:hypothetical protein
MSIRHRLGAAIAALALFATAIAGSQAATTGNATVQINTQPGAGLTASITGTSFGSIPYSFTDSAPLPGSLTITALDTRGTAAGWNIVLSATDFTGTVAGHSIPVNQLSLGTGVISRTAGAPSTGQTSVALNPVATTPAKIWSANVGSGDGDYSNAVPASLVVPGGTLVDSYTSVVTVAITSGP